MIKRTTFNSFSDLLMSYDGLSVLPPLFTRQVRTLRARAQMGPYLDRKHFQNDLERAMVRAK